MPAVLDAWTLCHQKENKEKAVFWAPHAAITGTRTVGGTMGGAKQTRSGWPESRHLGAQAANPIHKALPRLPA